MQAFHRFYKIGGGNFKQLNKAMIVLLPKEDEAARISDFRPINLIHSFAKLIAKVLSLRLTSIIADTISPAQSAFLRSKCIQDSFLKLDIAKAFDDVSWEYLLELLQVLGFSTRWRDWIAWMLSTSSSSFLLNGSPGPPLDHRRGLRQGDPLSPLLFVIAIDPLHRLIQVASDLNMLSPLPGREVKLRVSLYTGDVILFANPDKEEINTLMQLLQDFGNASGLKVNTAKSTATPIRCEGLDLSDILQGFGGLTKNFPLRYLSLPITTTRLRIMHL